jgi:hypothetical protein
MAGTSNFDNGFPNGVTIRGVPVVQLYPGRVFWVNNSSVAAPGGIGGSNASKGTFQRPFSTINGALDHCVASRGDIIAVAPGHSETVTTDGGIALDVAGVAIIGLGSGSLRPKIVLDTAAAAAVTVTAANVTLQNFALEASFADITNAIDVTAKWFSCIDCEFQEEGANLNFVDIIHCSSTTDNNADGLRVEGCISTAVDDAINSLINIKADLDRLVCKHNFVMHDNANALAMVLCATGKDLTDCDVTDNKYLSLKTSGDLLIDNDTTANSGIVANNLVSHADTAAEIICDADGVGLFNNYGSGVITASGYLLPAADS